MYQNSIDWTVSLGVVSSQGVCFVCAFPQRKVPDQDVAQGSYIALPLTLLLLLAAYNHEKVHNGTHLLQTWGSESVSCTTLALRNLFSWNKPHWNLALTWPSLKFGMTSRRMSLFYKQCLCMYSFLLIRLLLLFQVRIC